MRCPLAGSDLTTDNSADTCVFFPFMILPTDRTDPGKEAGFLLVANTLAEAPRAGRLKKSVFKNLVLFIMTLIFYGDLNLKMRLKIQTNSILK